MATKPRKNPPMKPKATDIVKKKLKLDVNETFLKEVEILSGRGLTNQQIYNYYGVSRDCWYDNIQWYPELESALLRGKAKTISMVSGRLMEKIKDGNLSAIIFYLKTQAKWSEQLPIGESGEKPEVPVLTINVSDPVDAARIYQQIMIGS